MVGLTAVTTNDGSRKNFSLCNAMKKMRREKPKIDGKKMYSEELLLIIKKMKKIDDFVQR